MLWSLLQALHHLVTYCMSRLSKQMFTLRPCLPRTVQVRGGLHCGVPGCPALHLFWQRHTNRHNLNSAVEHAVRQAHLHNLMLYGADCLHTVRAASESHPFIHTCTLQAMQVPIGRPGEWGNGWLLSAGKLHLGPPRPAGLMKQMLPHLCAS